MARRRIPQVVDGRLIVSGLDETANCSIAIDSAAWFSWITDQKNTSFTVVSTHGSITVRREQQRHDYYWYAYRWYEKKLHKSYIGKAEELTYRRLLDLMSPPGESVSPTSLSLSFLGDPVILYKKQSVEKLSRKALLLLAYLAVHSSRPQRREHLMTLLWPESSEEAARKNLRNTLWTIRTLLGEQVVQGNASLALDKNIFVDVWAFEQEMVHIEVSPSRQEALEKEHYQKALALYRGLFLNGVTIEDSSEMHLWLLLERERLKQAVLKVLLALIDTARNAGDWSTVLSLAHRSLLEDSLQEPIYRFQMEALARLGERGQALHQYNTLRIVLEHELGVQPLPETETLRMTILQGTLEPSNVAHSEHTTWLSAKHTYAPALALPHLPFVGRQSEMTSLHTELRLAAEGAFRIVLLTGDMGIGKSRLWQEWSTVLKTQKCATIVDMLALEVMQDAPFASLLTWFNQSPWLQQLFSPTSLLSPIVQKEILRRLPTLHLQWSDLPHFPAQSQETERLRVFDVLTQTLLAIQRHENFPLILFLDDAHWSDPMTIQWFDYLAQSLRSTPFLLVLAYRSEEASPALTALVARWQYQRIARHLLLPGLNEEEAQVVMRSSGKEALEKRHLYQQSAGNPYVLSELLRMSSGSIPTSLVDLVRMHIAHLSEVAHQVLQAAAILEPGIDFEMLRRTCGRSEDEMLDVLDELTQAGFLVEMKGQYVFSRPLVATITRESLSGPRRSALHRRAAKACELMTIAQLPLIVRQLAVHYQGAGEREQAAHYAEIAAEQARAMTDWEDAVRLCLQARTLAPTPARTLHLGLVLLEKGDFEEARAIFKVAFHEHQAHGDQRGAAHACLNVASVALKEEYYNEVVSWTQQALSILTTQDDPEGLALAHALLSSAEL